MKSIAEFIAQIESNNSNYNIWVYAQQGCYKQLKNTNKSNRFSYLKRMIESHMQIIIELDNNKLKQFLLLSEINVATHIVFKNSKVTAITA
ncbi:hypothetical protein [Photobacterium andalusiense]|uniref:Uncharacterized protein n=1 Tax=Photobacterium andalusiense TaxID=2204296 RepID=A0A1Y6MIT9_9GAMM|nr:hypothetical protein [Photobacterium andalusiense]SMY35111.1 hypothetical protein PAND9192_01779 [Photobacterium andalusiense]